MLTNIKSVDDNFYTSVLNSPKYTNVSCENNEPVVKRWLLLIVYNLELSREWRVIRWDLFEVITTNKFKFRLEFSCEGRLICCSVRFFSCPIKCIFILTLLFIYLELDFDLSMSLHSILSRAEILALLYHLWSREKSVRGNWWISCCHRFSDVSVWSVWFDGMYENQSQRIDFSE